MRSVITYAGANRHGADRIKWVFIMLCANGGCSRVKSGLQVSKLKRMQNLWYSVSCSVSDLPQCYLTTKHPLQKFNHRTKAKRTDRRKRENGRERGRQSDMFLSSLEKQTPAGLIRLCLISFDDPSHRLFLFSQSHFRTHTRILHILIFWMDLCFSLSSPSLTSPSFPPNISCLSPSFLVPISVFPRHL